MATALQRLPAFVLARQCFLMLSSDCLFWQTIGKPCFEVLRAQPLSATLFAFPAPLRNVNVKYRLPEAIAVQGAFHFGSNFFLRRKTKERLFILRKADAVRREDGPSFQRFLSLFNALQQSSDSHVVFSLSRGLSPDPDRYSALEV